MRIEEYCLRKYLAAWIDCGIKLLEYKYYQLEQMKTIKFHLFSLVLNSSGVKFVEHSIMEMRINT